MFGDDICHQILFAGVVLIELRGVNFLAVMLLSNGQEVNLRPLHPLDETALSRVIRATLVEFGADRPGFAWQDPELDAMSKTYAASGWIYLVAVEGGNVLGGAGIAPLSGVEATCELQKMYLAPSARGKGIGWQLMGSLLKQAHVLGYRRVYLETLSRMVAAQHLYRAWGFLKIELPLGQTGHGGCDCWFLKELQGTGGFGSL